MAGTRRRVKRGGTARVTPVEWLLASDEPAIRGMARRDLLGVPADDELSRTTEGPMVRALLADQQPDGGFGGHPYRKWTGAHWRLVSLVELEVPAGEPRTMAAADRVLRWLTDPANLKPARRIHGLPLSDASIQGNALAACSRLGIAEDPRVRLRGASRPRWWTGGERSRAAC